MLHTRCFTVPTDLGGGKSADELYCLTNSTLHSIFHSTTLGTICLVLLFAGVALLMLAALGGMCFTTKENEAVVVERFGAFHRVAYPGLRFKVPVVDRIAARVDMGIQRLETQITTRTLDGVSVVLVVQLHYMMMDSDAIPHTYPSYPHVEDIAYEYIWDTVCSLVSGRTLKEVEFDHAKMTSAVFHTLHALAAYGHEPVVVLITAIETSDEVTKGLENIMLWKKRAATLAEMEPRQEVSGGDKGPTIGDYATLQEAIHDVATAATEWKEAVENVTVKREDPDFSNDPNGYDKNPYVPHGGEHV